MTFKLKLLILLFYCLWFFANPLSARTEKIKVAQYEVEFLEKAIMNFKNDLGRFPAQDEGLNVLIFKAKNEDNWKGPYINKSHVPLDSWSHHYIYLFPAKYGNKEYDLYSYGPNGIDEYGKGDDIANWKK